MYDLKALYIEDDPSLQKQTALALQKLFRSLVIAKDGDEAIEKFYVNQDIDLVITDIHLPYKNGFEVLEILRQTKENLYAIFVSAHSFDEHIESIFEFNIGLNSYIKKPYEIKDLLEKIQKISTKLEAHKILYKERSLYVQYQNAIDNSAIVSKTDLEGTITYVNDAFCMITEYKKDELIGKNHSIIRNKETPNEYCKTLWKTIKAKMIFKSKMMANTTKSGKRFYSDVTILPILDENREIVEYLSIRFDTTEMTMNLLDAQRAKQSQEKFLANMSHEIRTPLNGILGFTKVLKRKIEDPKLLGYVNIIDSSGEHLLGLISDILDISKLQEGKMELENIWFNPHKEFTAIKNLFEANAQEKQIEFVCNLCKRIKLDAEEKIELFGDIRKLKQVLSNLISNAIKFTPQGGTIIFDIEPLAKDGEEAIFKMSVKDSGIGIEGEKFESIFEPFKQADLSTTREYGGTGLGLAISKQIVELMNGKILVKSEVGKGSEFYFIIRLPFRKLEETSSSNKESHSTVKKKIFGKVLVAEDVAINQKLMGILFENLGIETIFVSDGSEAVQVFSENRSLFDMIFLDINMPVMDGIEACKKINQIQQSIHTKIPLVALTANAIAGDRERFLEKGFDEYLSKPIEIEQLENLLYRYLSVADTTRNTIPQQEQNAFDIPNLIELQKNANKLSFSARYR